ncbi:translocase of chloroplast 101, chloroplastic-like isoform X1 [Actinidia eriantha]|uniref:translocase of chloroplast 101, chloroplastic-like isoform X1 n=1 Tax=Actinidia eriantha TaxID=165200 RepID=UPI00258EB256|nr:translocase of chloroplast 101, chloroplastic-like isoform X1 [Actinidia eriantha]XP_057489274.1 translocase of chloroplast 101, chloroplastic-like isoform X1 [Actinidia eriantha]XP_057489275.1 translocase of chloroplast 101, chloroplastic-like isoform X1 [Actinidia eriantha]XP_057489276.1 translocase of chloroplast 101, chloroplastic-like isoform X1 [Actinidia eriantha]XP_057489277.1 translocase of chloroplast 101, chloroplastic-like isoform X1 [Actinidia eriantha]XP_057489279.1 translocas
MDSKLGELSHSTPSVSGSSSLPIRAPPTVDSDFEFSYFTNGQENHYSSSSSVSSSEDEFETAWERPFVEDPDDETLEESVVVKDFVVSRAFVKDPDGESLEESSHVEEYGGFRPFVKDPDDESVEESGIVEDTKDPDGESQEESSTVEEYGVFRPFVKDPDDESVEESGIVEECGVSTTFVKDPDDESGEERRIVEEYDVSRAFVKDPDDETQEESGNLEDFVVSRPLGEDPDQYFGEPAIVDVGISTIRKLSVPIALLSRESDDDSVGSKELDDDWFSGAVRVPGADLLGRTDSGIKVKVFGVGEEEEEELSFNDSVSAEVGSAEGCTAAKYSLNDSVEAELTKDEVLDDAEEARVESFGANEDDFLHENSEINNNDLDLVGEIEGLQKMAQRESQVEDRSMQGQNIVGWGDIDALRMDSITRMDMAIDCEEEKKAMEGGDIVSGIHKEGPSIDETEGTILTKFEARVGSFVGCSDVEPVDRAILGVEIQNTDNTGFSELYPSQETVCYGNDISPGTVKDNVVEEGLHGKPNTQDTQSLFSNFDPEFELKSVVKGEAGHDPDNSEEGSFSGDYFKGLTFGVWDTTKLVMEDLEQSLTPTSPEDSSQHLLQTSERSIVMDSDEEVDTNGESEGEELFDSTVWAALRKAAGSDSGSLTATSANGSRVSSLEHPADSIASVNLPAPQSGEYVENLSGEEKQKLEKIQLVRVKFLRLVQRLGYSSEDSIAAQVLYLLNVSAGRPSSQSFSFEVAKRTAMQLEAVGRDDLDFSLNILVLGKTGVGKSATINSIFGEKKAMIDAFKPATTAVNNIVGRIDGIKVRVFDTPGLRSSLMEQSFNMKTLLSIKKLTKKFPLDIVLYVDRLDTQRGDLNDLPLVRSITSFLGSSIWHNAIVTLTHAASDPPDGPSGSPLSYDLFVAQRSRIIQQLISQAVGDLHMMSPSLMTPVSLVENHPSCQKSEDGQTTLPNGERWRSRLLLLCCSMKILSEANSVAKTQDLFNHGKLFGFRTRSPLLPSFLSSLLQSNAQPKLPSQQGGDYVDPDIELVDFSDADQMDDDEYDQLPPFNPLKRSEIAMLSKEQRNAYFEEYDYWVSLLQKKQLREEVKRLRELKKRGKDGPDCYGYAEEVGYDETGVPAAEAVPLPDMVLPPSFDQDNPAYIYRFLEPKSQLLTRPVLDLHGWDHDCGYDGVSLESNLAIAGCLPAEIAVQITKGKKDFTIHFDSSVAAKHGDHGSTMAGIDIQTVGKQLVYVLKGETKTNKTTAGVSVTFLGENVATGLKCENHITGKKGFVMVGSTGVIRSQGDTAYEANFEFRLKEKDFSIGQDQTTANLSLVRWRGDLVWGGNLQSQFSVGQTSKMVVQAGLNSKLSGQLSVRTSSSERLQIALLGIFPIANAIVRKIFPG